MAANLYRLQFEHGDWPPRYHHAKNLGHVYQVWGALAVNLAPSDDSYALQQGGVGRPGTGGPTLANPTGHLLLGEDKFCVWVETIPSTLNDSECPPASV